MVAEVSLHEIAPRLARARDALRRERFVRRREIRHCEIRQLEIQRLVAHRELQLVRAQAAGKRGYIRERQRKLNDARRKLRYWERRLDDLRAAVV